MIRGDLMAPRTTTVTTAMSSVMSVMSPALRLRGAGVTETFTCCPSVVKNSIRCPAETGMRRINVANALPLLF
jgi:hypothetical protein